MINHPYTYELLVADRQRQLRADSYRWSLARMARRTRRARDESVSAAKLRVVRASAADVSQEPNAAGCAGRAA